MFFSGIANMLLRYYYPNERNVIHQNDNKYKALDSISYLKKSL